MDDKNQSFERGRILSVTPSFKIDSYEEAVDHYVDWLGFNLDWDAALVRKLETVRRDLLAMATASGGGS